MNEYTIVIDSTTDLPPEFAEELGLVVIPYLFHMDGKEYLNYLDHREFPIKDFYNALRAGRTASTSLVTEQRYTETFEPYLKEGKDLIYMCLSTALSSSHSQAVLAAEALSKRYPERKLEIIDSLCASMGQGLLAYYASKAREAGKTVTEAADYIRKLIPNLCHWVIADDLNHLRRGGRVSGASAFVGTMLNIKPIIHVDDIGRLIPVAKVRGLTNAREYITDRFKETSLDPDQIVFISHSDSYDEAVKVQELIQTKLGLSRFVVSYIGPVIGAHTGPGTLALFFTGSKR